MKEPDTQTDSARPSIWAPDSQIALTLAPEGEVKAEAADTDHGAVFTRRWVVELILDLADYTADRPLYDLVAVEPAAGDGAFLVPMVERLSAACRRDGKTLKDAIGALRALDLQTGSVQTARKAVGRTLTEAGWLQDESKAFAAASIKQGDFLLQPHSFDEADFVLGNPPYIRLEAVPTARSDAYRRACPTMSGRADIYVGFFEIGLKALKPTGTLAFICADRWMRNQYGRQLRQLVAGHFSLEAAIEMHDVNAFADEVSAYPSVVVIRRRQQEPVLVAETKAAFGPAEAKSLKVWATAAAVGDEHDEPTVRAGVLHGWFPGRASWPAGSPARIAILQELEERLPPLEHKATGTRVGIGVATGADGVFITKDTSVAEEERLLPLAMAGDTMSGTLDWSGHYLADPWRTDDSGLIEPSDYPKLAAYYETNINQLCGRNIAKRRPKDWFRTIDRVDHSLIKKPKLFFPDIKASIHPVLDKGETYPHHNLYFVVSEQWDLEVLGGLLLSRVAQLFIEAYAVRMRGGYLRFQAQYLRRIRVPRLTDVSRRDAQRLKLAFRSRDVEASTNCALRLYGLTALPK